MNQGWIRQSKGSITIVVQVIPRAAQNAVQGLHGDALKIRLSAPPVEGKANAELISFLAEKLNIPKSSIVLKSGLTQRRKILALSGLAAAEIEKRLLG
jgi:uncharacterized protein (TIGR00251 family)